MTRKKLFLIPLLALLLVICGGSTYRRTTWYDWFFNPSYRLWYSPLKLDKYDPGFGFCIWSDANDVYRHEDHVLFVRWGLAMDRSGRVLAYDPSAFDAAYGLPDIAEGYGITDTPPLFDPAVLTLDFSAADLIDLGEYGPLTGLSRAGHISFIFEFILTDGRMLVIHADRLPEAMEAADPDPWAYFSITHASVLDFFAETQTVLYQHPGSQTRPYKHISQFTNGYAHYDLARAQKLAQQEAIP